MTWINSLRLAVGLVLVVGVVGGSTFVLDRRELQVTSDRASIAALTYEVGTDYAGIVVKQYVQEGDSVAQGDPIVAVSSLALAHDVAVGLVDPVTATFTVTEDGLMIMSASAAGTVTSLGQSPGSFVQAGQVLAAVERTGTLFVTAELDLSPRDYGKLEQGAAVTITLPNQTRLAGTLEAWDVTAAEERARAVVEVVSDELVQDSANGLVRSGAPVSVSIELRRDGVLSDVRTSVVDFLRKVGL